MDINENGPTLQHRARLGRNPVRLQPISKCLRIESDRPMNTVVRYLTLLRQPVHMLDGPAGRLRDDFRAN